jgi:hypothetical protein
MGQFCCKETTVLPSTSTLIQIKPAEPKINPRLTISSRPAKEISTGFLHSPLSPAPWSLKSPGQISIVSLNNQPSLAHLRDNDQNEVSMSYCESVESSQMISSPLVTPATSRHRKLMLSPEVPALALNFSERRFYNLITMLLKTQLESPTDENLITQEELQRQISQISQYMDPDRILFLQNQAKIVQELTFKDSSRIA